MEGARREGEEEGKARGRRERKTCAMMYCAVLCCILLCFDGLCRVVFACAVL